MLKKIFSIIFYILSGFTIIGACGVAFIKNSVFEFKFAVAAVFLVVSLVLIGIGLLIVGFEKWKQVLGTTLLIAAGMAFVDIISLYSILSAPQEYQQAVFNGEVPPLQSYISYRDGLIFTGGLILIGILFVVNRNQKSTV